MVIPAGRDLRRSCRAFVAAAFDALREEHVIPTPIFLPYVAVGRDYFGDTVRADPIVLGEHCERYPRHIAKAVELLLGTGIDGPYGLALGPEPYTRVLETSEHGGYPLLDHLRKILGGPLVWAPGIEGGAVVSMRGGDFLFEPGRGVTPEAAVALAP